MSRITFMDRLLSGEILDLDEIEEDIDAWHQTKQPGVTLPAWLGLSDQEYGFFVEQPASLRVIAHARKYDTDFFGLLSGADDGLALAARGASPEEVLQLKKWLQKTGRL